MGIVLTKLPRGDIGFLLKQDRHPNDVEVTASLRGHWEGWRRSKKVLSAH